MNFGALGRNRTCDQEIRRLLLYPLSYEGIGPCFWAALSLSCAGAARLELERDYAATNHFKTSPLD